MADNREPEGQRDHEDPDEMPVEDAAPDAGGEQTREQGGTEGPYAADQGERDGVQGAQHGRTRAHVVQHELDGGETHGDAAAHHQRGRRDGPEGRRHAPAQEHVAHGQEGEEEGVGVGAEAHDARGADARLEPGEHDQEVQGLREAADHHEDADPERREPEPAQVDGREEEDGDDGRVGEGQHHDVRVEVERHGHVGGPEEFEGRHLLGLVGRGFGMADERLKSTQPN